MPDPKYRVWWVPQIPGQPFEVECETLRDAVALTDVLAKYDLFQYDHRIKPDYCNVGGVQTYDAEEGWLDLDEEEYADEAATPLSMVVTSRVGTRP